MQIGTKPPLFVYAFKIILRPSKFEDQGPLKNCEALNFFKKGPKGPWKFVLILTPACRDTILCERHQSCCANQGHVEGPENAPRRRVDLLFWSLNNKRLGEVHYKGPNPSLAHSHALSHDPRFAQHLQILSFNHIILSEFETEHWRSQIQRFHVT